MIDCNRKDIAMTGSEQGAVELVNYLNEISESQIPAYGMQTMRRGD